MTHALAETLTEDAQEVDVDSILKDEEAPSDEKDIRKIPQRKPPKDGLCRRCGENKPINRLMLCYPCWVKSELEKHGWREGQPHPDWCACEGVKDHQRKSDGN